MSVFLCQRCDNLRDADNGCREGTNFGLICSDCMDEEEEYEGCGGDFTPAQQDIIDALTAEEEDDDRP